MFTQEIYNCLSLNLEETDLTNLGLISKNTLFLLNKYKIKLILDHNKRYKFITVLQYNRNNQVISSSSYEKFNIKQYLNKHKSVKKILFEFNNVAGFYFENKTKFNFYEDYKFDLTKHILSKHIFIFDRHELVNGFQLMNSNSIKYLYCGFKISSSILAPNYITTNNKSLFLLDKESMFLLKEKIQLNISFDNKFFPDFIKSSSFNKTNKDICGTINNIDAKSIEELLNINKNYVIKGLTISLCYKIGHICDLDFINSFENLEKLQIDKITLSKKFMFPKKLKTLVLHSTKISRNIFKKISKLKYLSELSIYTYNVLLTKLSNNLRYLEILNTPIHYPMDYDIFTNLDFLKLDGFNRISLDLQKYKMRYIIISCTRTYTEIFFNKNTYHKTINIRGTNFVFNNLKTEKLVCSENGIIPDFENCEIHKLFINNTKIINFPNSVREVYLEDMKLYSFSDFPDSVEKIHIKEYRYSYHKQGQFPKNLKELGIGSFWTKPTKKYHNYKTYDSQFLKAQHLKKFITDCDTSCIYFPIGNILTTYINKRGQRCVIY